MSYNNVTYSVTKIGSRAFLQNTEITSVTIPNTITEVSHEAFLGCQNLTTINFSGGLTLIENFAFTGCGISELVLPVGLTDIGDVAFAGCASLERIILPNSLNHLGYASFGNLSNLREIVSYNPTPPTFSTRDGQSGEMFSNTLASSVTLRVPVGAKSAYENADEWRNFQIVEDATLNTKEVVSEVENDKLSVYPNPTTGIFFINIEKKTTATVYAMTGQVVKSLQLNKGTNEVDITGVKAGVYIVQVDNKTARIIKK